MRWPISSRIIKILQSSIGITASWRMGGKSFRLVGVFLSLKTKPLKRYVLSSRGADLLSLEMTTNGFGEALWSPLILLCKCLLIIALLAKTFSLSAKVELLFLTVLHLRSRISSSLASSFGRSTCGCSVLLSMQDNEVCKKSEMNWV